MELTQEEQERLQRIHNKGNTFEIAFCGHFSAGKSTLLNGLLGAEVLPTSPIPTSANIIRIMSGRLGLDILDDRGFVTRSFDEEIPWEKVRSWGKDGNAVSGITIRAPLNLLGENGVIADTPGVDSTDPTHAEVTTEQLFATDVIVYVMDYNHVQSETNLYFLKELSESGKPVIIVINQIDKHREEEVQADVFKEQVESLFESWYIRYAAFYFTSMKEPDHPLNEFDSLRRKLTSIFAASSQFHASAEAALNKGFHESLVNRLRGVSEERMSEIAASAEAKGFSTEELEEASQLEEEYEELRTWEEALEKSYEDSMKRVYDNVYLFPYTAMELLKQAVEAIQRSFKTGLLFAGRKTEEERSRRLKQLAVEVNDTIRAQLLYHVEDYFRSLETGRLDNQDEFSRAMDRLLITVDEEWLRERIRGAENKTEYIYTLAGKLNDELIRDVRRQAGEVLQVYLSGIKRAKEEDLEAAAEKKERFSELEALHAEKEREEIRLNKELAEAEQYEPRAGSVKPLLDQIRDAEGAEAEEETIWSTAVTGREETFTEEAMQPEPEAPAFDEEEAETWARSLKAWLETLEEGPVTSREIKLLTDMLKKAEDQTMTISLFGAFSAGKSSFANAMLGRKIMPVAPHPTTAAVNTVKMPPSPELDQQAEIRVKTRAALSQEIASVAESLRIVLDIDTIGKFNPRSVRTKSRMQRSALDYLAVLQKSLREKKVTFGGIIETSIQEVEPYVADEYTACLIDEIVMYADTDFTKMGGILVDTPGVNSVHGRHTNVAFKQLERSDAVFYLTYYNHAFSKADAYFLEQMNEINQSFDQDKLYFFINASDLASDQQELREVRDHVSGELKRFGYKSPRLFHVSSRGAFEGGDTSFDTFYNYFKTDISGELKRLTYQMTAEAESRLLARIEAFAVEKQKMTDADAERLHHQKQLLQDEEEALNQLDFHFVRRDAERELEQLMLYLRKRMTYVLHDYFQSAINVSTISGDGRRELQQSLEAAVIDWEMMGRRFLFQEWEAVSIRLNYAVQRLFRKWTEQYEKKIREISANAFVERPRASVELKTGEGELRLLEKPEQYASRVKSKKQFFEGDELKHLKDDLTAEASGRIQLFLKQEEEQAFEKLHPELLRLEEEVRNLASESVRQEKDIIERYLSEENDFSDAPLERHEKEIAPKRPDALSRGNNPL
ncbi:dynamin family protein [Alkalicoccus urumqiensis]|uniref:Dynamin N-terminal domain-containing protein n=1 Tax=Alkalicoccus urumqiensis TaxID=1548213 RepID=A0A2P6ML09_ALKUR|nr:dynamin family protein [Alkalicoccus urumqiensis]PRO66959.1 hypothetical protein C6I21_03280 [Alkalicoccus urumqiensis]